MLFLNGCLSTPYPLPCPAFTPPVAPYQGSVKLLMRQGEHSIPQRMYGNLQCKTISSRPINVELSLYHRGHVTNTRSSEPQRRQTSPGKKEKTSPRHSPPNLLLCQPFHILFFSLPAIFICCCPHQPTAAGLMRKTHQPSASSRRALPGEICRTFR